MLKLVGGVLVIGALGMLGFDIAKGYSQRPQLLRSLQTALQFLETEINYGATPLPSALDKVARVLEPNLAIFFKTVSQVLQQPVAMEVAWEKGLEALIIGTPLGPKEIELLVPLGSVLGASDRADQVKHLRLTLHQLENAEKKAREVGEKNGSMWRYLGFLVGLMLVLTLY